jgi:hypothetical protein
VDGREIDNFKAQVAKDVAPARLQNVRGYVVRNSPLLQGVAVEK